MSLYFNIDHHLDANCSVRQIICERKEIEHGIKYLLKPGNFL